MPSDFNHEPRRAGKHLVMATCMAVGLGLSTVAGAGTPATTVPDESGAAEPAASQPVSDSTLRQFASAAESVQEIQESFAAESQQLQNQTEARMIASVEQAGMTVEEFRTLFERIQTDAELAARFDEIRGQGQ